MKKISTSCCLLLTSYLCFAQMQPADSLTGTYVGLLYYANPSSNPWTITPITLYVSNIDSINCKVQITDYGNLVGYPTYYTDYFTCNITAPLNYYTKFYNSDSLRLIADNVPQPQPNQPYSRRFYVKRLNNITVGIEQLSITKEAFAIFPNPSTNLINIACKTFSGKVQLSIIDILGNEVKWQTANICNGVATIEVSELKKGIYFLQIKTEQGITIKKIIIN